MKKTYLIVSLFIIGLIIFCAFFSLITKILWLQIVLGIYFYIAIIAAFVLTFLNINNKKDKHTIFKSIGSAIIWGPLLILEIAGVTYILIFERKPGPIYLKGK